MILYRVDGIFILISSPRYLLENNNNNNNNNIIRINALARFALGSLNHTTTTTTTTTDNNDYASANGRRDWSVLLFASRRCCGCTRTSAAGRALVWWGSPRSWRPQRFFPIPFPAADDYGREARTIISSRRNYRTHPVFSLSRSRIDPCPP